MPAFADYEFIVVGNLRPRITEALRRSGKSGKDVEFGNNRGGLTNPFCLLGNAAANFLKERLLDFENLLLRGKDLLFVLFQLRRHEPFRPHECLLPIVVIRNQVQIGFGNFDVITEDLIEPDL